ncbi:MAG: lipid kinase [Hyphomicrobiaceae bacterium]|nr:lipid kinase [Hyphomicrobiaceae bacterium]
MGLAVGTATQYHRPTAPRRALLLVNRNARRGAAPIESVIARLGQRGIETSIETFATPAEASDDIVRRRGAFDCVIIAGGDGTLSSAARGIRETGLPMGILPMGTANDLARTLEIPEDLARAADIIAAGRTRRIDVGSVNGHLFFNVASIGLSADLARNLCRDTKRRWGRLGYAVAAIGALASARPFSTWITSKDGTVRVKTMQIAVGNGRHYGGGNVVHYAARIDDGHLDLYSLEVRSVWKLALMAPSFRAGGHGAWKEVRTAHCVAFDVETRRPRSVNADGEIVTTTPARFEVHPAAVEVYVP